MGSAWQRRRTMMRIRIGLAISAAWLMGAPAAAPSPAVGPRTSAGTSLIDARLASRPRVRDRRGQGADVLVGGMSFVASSRSQFDRVIRTESYGALGDRLQKKTLDTTVAERRQEG